MDKLKSVIKIAVFIFLVILLACLGSANDPFMTNLFKVTGWFALVLFFSKVIFGS